MKTIGIIGGKGIMGSFFAKIFRKNSFRVIISDLHTELSNKKLVQLADVVVIAVPISVTRKVIREIVPHTHRNQLLMDMTSLKVFPVKEMLKSKANVIGLHPMFRPGPAGLKKQNIAICPARASQKEITLLKKLFKQEGANVNIMTPKRHDHLMAVIQVLIHFHSMVLGQTLRSLGTNMKEIMKVMSPVYRLQFDVVCRIFSQDPGLYASIGMENHETKKITKHFLAQTQLLRKILIKKDSKKFIQHFKKTSSFLGPFSKKALLESDKILSYFSTL